MITVKCKVAELYELRAQLGGIKVTQPVEGKEGETVVLAEYKGIFNEDGVLEGTKRAILKSLRVLQNEIEPIDKQRQEIGQYKDETLTPEELQTVIQEKEQQLLTDDVEFSTELIDFSKIENLSFSMNYDFAYQKLFK